MPDDRAETSSVRIKPGGTRAYIVRRLRFGGFDALAEQVIADQMSARKAALLAGFGDARVRVRRGERVVTELEWEQLQRRLRLAEQKAERVQKPSRESLQKTDRDSSARKVDIAALIG
jgi:hypothetical protein